MQHVIEPVGDDEPTSPQDAPYWLAWPDDLDAEFVVIPYRELSKKWVPPVFAAMPRQVAA